MLIVGCFCGLASQMNQYAFVTMLRGRFPDADIRMVDACGWLKNLGHNGYELERLFGIKSDFVDARLVQRLANFHLGHGFPAKVFNVFHRLRCRMIGVKKTQIQMNDLAVDSAALINIDVSRDWLFWGNCQMWPFVEAEEKLRKAFVFRRPIQGRNAEMLSKMASCNSVSIHVRRGDYAKWGFVLLGEDYYMRAIKEIEKRVPNPHYFVFSDDLGVARRIMGERSDVTYVEGNRGLDSYIDMQLMSSCRHNIIANSGFSTMAAWLNTAVDRIVVSPTDIPEMKGVVVV